MNRSVNIAPILAVGASLVTFAGLTACKRTASNDQPELANPPAQVDDHGHDHPDDASHDHPHDGGMSGHGDEVFLGSTAVGDFTVVCWQGHGAIAPGKELHLVVKLPYSDNGATVVRVWIGTEDRLASVVAKADYAATHDDYDVHCEAPAPLPDDTRWWIELERPDGSKHLGSIEVQ